MPHQLLHVYAKHYEGNGQVLLIRIVRYSLDGKVTPNRYDWQTLTVTFRSHIRPSCVFGIHGGD